MIQLQILNKILNTQNNSIIEDNLLDESYFNQYTKEYKFIEDHYKKYNQVPDKATFLAKFPEFELIEVTETDKYLIDTLREEYLYDKSVPIVQEIGKLLQTDSNAAIEYMLNATKELQPNFDLAGTNIIKDALDRYNEYLSRKDNQDKWYFTTGFRELDDLLHGIQRGEELIVLFARVNQGKSWILEKITSHIWQLGFNVGYISPEMSASSIGYRFDTLYKNYSNKALMWGNDLNENEYKNYLEDLSKIKNNFIVSTPLDFDKKITVTKIRNWILKYKLDYVAIDGIKYLTDERYKKGDNTTTTLTNISEDLMQLSMDLKIPVVIVVQANRNGVIEKEKDGTPELEDIRDSDGISHNASKVLSIRQLENEVLEIGIKKQRFGPVGGKLKYQWNIDLGQFTYYPSEDAPKTVKKENNKQIENIVNTYQDVEDVF